MERGQDNENKSCSIECRFFFSFVYRTNMSDKCAQTSSGTHSLNNELLASMFYIFRWLVHRIDIISYPPSSHESVTQMQIGFDCSRDQCMHFQGVFLSLPLPFPLRLASLLVFGLLISIANAIYIARITLLCTIICLAIWFTTREIQCTKTINGNSNVNGYSDGDDNSKIWFGHIK